MGGSPGQPLANVCLTAQSCRNDNFISSWWAATTTRFTRLTVYVMENGQRIQFNAERCLKKTGKVVIRHRDIQDFKITYILIKYSFEMFYINCG